jgi:hypothetical protein
LQRELNRHHNPKAPSLDLKLNESEKLKWRNKQLNDSIKRLKRLSAEAEAKEQKMLNEATSKMDQLASAKLETDRQLTETSYKLNEFIKKFPSHQHDKEEKRKLKMKKTISISDD